VRTRAGGYNAVKRATKSVCKLVEFNPTEVLRFAQYSSIHPLDQKTTDMIAKATLDPQVP
jgi:hypothetical protein